MMVVMTQKDFNKKSVKVLYTTKKDLGEAMDFLINLFTDTYLTYEEVEYIFLMYIHHTHQFLRENLDIKPIQLHRSIVRRLKSIQRDAIEYELYETAQNIKRFLEYGVPLKKDVMDE
jgi:hypothetical protein